jgi:hypothetical protein
MISDIKYILLRKWIKKLKTEDLRGLIAERRKDCHLSYDPHKAPDRPVKERGRKVGVVGTAGFMI